MPSSVGIILPLPFSNFAHSISRETELEIVEQEKNVKLNADKLFE